MALRDPTGTPALPVTLDDVRAARERIGDAAGGTPCRPTHSPDRLGAHTWLKYENLHPTGSFKERGAVNKLRSLGDDERRRGVITASAGNHAQALAYHATRLGIAATVVMPEATPLVKVSNTRRFGARVVLHGAGRRSVSFNGARGGGPNRPERGETGPPSAALQSDLECKRCSRGARLP